MGRLIVCSKWLFRGSKKDIDETDACRTMVKQTLKEALILILVAVGVALAVHVLHPDSVRLIPSTIERSTASPVQTADGGLEISIEDALAHHRNNSALFADARHPADFEAGHIQDAVHLYLGDQEKWLPQFVSATDPLALIITYCDGEDCQLAEQLAELLQINGFASVRYLKNGWSRWQERGFPVE
jgi:rhodanese-related sulfurtransferase